MEKKQNKFINYLSNNKFYIISFLSAFLILFLLMNQVVMYADDYILQIQSTQSFGDLLRYLINHYFEWGGGHTPLLVTILFKFGFGAWKVINTLIITTMFYLIAKTFSKDFKHFGIYFFIEWIIFYIINVYVVRECVYWLDGSMAYIVSTFELFMFIYILYTRFILNQSKKSDNYWVPIVTFLSGWSSAQTSGMTLIISLLFFIWYKFIKHHKINKKFLLFLIPALLGSALFFLSPGNGVRMDTFELYSSLNLINRSLYRIGETTSLTFNYRYFLLTEMPFFIFMFSYLILYLGINQIKMANNKIEKILSIGSTTIEFIFLATSIIVNFIPNVEFVNYTFNFANLYELKATNTLSFIHIAPYLFVLLFLFANFITIIIHSQNEKNPILLILFLVIYGSQYAMIMAPYTPLRTCITSLIFLIFAIIYLINYLYKKEDIFEIVPLLILYVDLNIAFICYIFINILLKNNATKKMAMIISMVPLLYMAFVNYRVMYINYYENKIIYNENVERIKAYQEGDTVIYLKKPKDEVYAFTPMIGTDWIEYDIKLYFNVPDYVELRYEED